MSGMQAPGADRPAAAEAWGWTRRQRVGLGILLTLLLGVLVVAYVRRPAGLDEAAVLVEGKPLVLPQRIDPNTATIAELTRIPHVGEALAGKIVAYREARKGTAADGIVFRQLGDLDPIPGIGKKLLDQLEPFLQFPEDAEGAPAP